MSTEELRKAVEAVKWLAGIADERAASHLAVIRNALRDQDAEIARLQAVVNRLRQAITAHLGGENNG